MKLLHLFLTFVLVTAHVVPAAATPAFAFTEELSDESHAAEEAPWYESIPEMLAAGEYEEGVVIAGIDMSRAKRPEDPGSALETEVLRKDAEELICVNSDVVSEEQDFLAWLRSIRNRISGHDDGVCITSIRRSDMTTARILELLSADDSVVFAEPNYTVSMDSLDVDANTEDVLSVTNVSAGESADTDAASSPGTEGTLSATNASAEESVDTNDSSFSETEETLFTTNAPSQESVDTEAAPSSETEETLSTTNASSEVSVGSDNEETANEENQTIYADENQEISDATSGSADIKQGLNPSLTTLQWSNSKDVTMRAPDTEDNYSMNIPGWPDGSNMDKEIVVAVLDYPVDFTNPDLQDVAYTFSPELMDKLGCDEHGFNATWESEDGRLAYFDEGDHGSHVAGIIGASWDGRGISGVGSNVRIVSVQIANKDGKTSLVNALRGMNFVKEANENGADIRITNNSWGLYQGSKALDAAVTELGETGVISFFASGNDSRDLNDYKDICSTMANNPYAIIVGSIDVSGNLAESSNYGNGIVTLAAPGVGILSCMLSRSELFFPMMTGNKYYENFEGDTPALQIYQIDPETGEKVEGSDGVIVRADEAMGFEGEKVLRVSPDASFVQDLYGDLEYSFRIEFGNVPNVEAGDYIGFAFGGRCMILMGSIAGNDDYFNVGNNKDCWEACDYMLTDEDLVQENLSIDVSMLTTDNCEEVFFDAVGIGSERSPYGFKSGTSMASPAAAGAGAVLASRHYSEIAEMNAESAKKLAGLVRSSVRPIPSLAGKISTGGIIDLSVDTEAVPSEFSPDITDFSVSGTEVRITGSSFGDSAGTVRISKYVLGRESAEIESEISEWSDGFVTLQLKNNFEGIMEVELNDTNGKKDTMVKFISKSGNLFETEHHFAAGTGDPFEFDEPQESQPAVIGDFESPGILMPLGDRLYYMPAATKVEHYSAYRFLFCYDSAEDKWIEDSIPPLPEWLRLVSGTVCDGTLYVKGTVTDTDESGSIPYIPLNIDWSNEEIKIYSYTPGDEGWKECSVENVYPEFTLFAADDSLILAGSSFIMPDGTYDNAFWNSSIMKYDPMSGAGDVICAMPEELLNPIAVCAFGHICVCDEDGGTLYVLSGDSSDTDMTEISLPVDRRNGFSLAGNEDVLMLIGKVTDDGSTETYILSEGDNEFSPYEKRVSDGAVYGSASVIHNDRLFVIATGIFEPDVRIFRSTLLKEPEKESFTITYDLNGGSFNGSTEDITEVYTEGAVISIHAAPSREGYAFTYWKGSEYHPGDEYTVTGEHTFTAQWEKAPEPTEPTASDITDTPTRPTGSGNDTQSFTDTQTGPGTKSGNDTQTGSGTQTANSTQTGSGTKTANSTQTGSVIKTGNSTQTDSGTKTGNAVQTTNAARTGDESPVLLWIVLASFSLLTFLLISLHSLTAGS